MPANKSPGPDGLSWEFFRVCWATVKEDVLVAVTVVSLGRDQGLGRLNSAFITLIPKREGAADLKDFRPISLVHRFANSLPRSWLCGLRP
jgi:mannosylglycoprotein endo-beta-mannosidase